MRGPNARKRARSIAEESRVNCPFSVTIDLTQKSGKSNHTRRRERHNAPEDGKMRFFQTSPFSPAGKFKTDKPMDMHYDVIPRRGWLDMTRYGSFRRKCFARSYNFVLQRGGEHMLMDSWKVNGQKYYIEGFVYIANESTMQRQKAASDADSAGAIGKPSGDWVARILDIRAADVHHVYARVCWMYWPDELPSGTLHGKIRVCGRQPYHGVNELIASNHMDIINVVSITSAATVSHWIESDDEEVQEALYWRQAFDCRTSQLSSVELICNCATPANPDKTLIGCTNKECGTWLHHECLLDDVLTKVCERLGTDKPHVSQASKSKSDNINENIARLISRAGTTVQHTPTAFGVRNGRDISNFARNAENIPSKSMKNMLSDPMPGSHKAIAPSPEDESRGTKNDNASKYRGLFKATLKIDNGPTTWDIVDLRTDVMHGHRSFSEPAECLVCGCIL